MTLHPDLPLSLHGRSRLSIRPLIERIARADARYRQMQALERLDDRLLRDIGITASDVRREFSRSSWR